MEFRINDIRKKLLHIFMIVKVNCHFRKILLGNTKLILGLYIIISY